MVRNRSVYRCTECGHEHPKWVGKCEGCGEWNTVAEEPVASGKAGRRVEAGHARPGHTRSAHVKPVRLRDTPESSLHRWQTGIKELDYVVGGGIVPGSLTLIGGEPGVGKSTLLLQAAGRLELSGRTVLYASGEESTDQLRLRALRLGSEAESVHALGETALEPILAASLALSAQVLILDSIQTVSTDTLESAPGNVGQVRECAGLLMRFAKATGTAVIVVGHVTKGGGIAGPKTLEHIVDTVLYFEGDGALDYRLLRATKNRFGPVDELGVFRLTERGLEPVANPSAIFLAARAANVSGSAVTALMEGTRPVLVEVQALAARAGYGTPQRVATGFEQKRLAVLLAVLERRAGLSFADLDVFVQATAGVRLIEPGSDLAIAAALLSSLNDRPAPPDALFLGEIGLGGEIRPSAGLERRVGEAVRLGFTRVFGAARGTLTVPGATLVPLEHIGDLVRALAA